MLQSLINGIRSLFQSGKVTLSDTTQQVIKIQFEDRDGTIRDSVPYFQHFGFRSHPPKESDCLILLLEGNNEIPICIATHRRGKEFEAIAEGAIRIYTNEDARIDLSGNDITSNSDSIDLKNNDDESKIKFTEEKTEIKGETAEVSSLGSSKVTVTGNEAEIEGALYFKKQGSGTHLVEDLSDLVQAITQITTTTPSGPGAISPTSITQLNLIRTRIMAKLRS